MRERVAVIVPGLMGSILSYNPGGGPKSDVWSDDLSANYRALLQNPNLLAWTGNRASARLLTDVTFDAGGSRLPAKRLWGLTLDFLAAHPQFRMPGHQIQFSYDWRGSLIESARGLAAALSDRLGVSASQRPAGASPKFAFLSHSMGALVVRIAVGIGALHPAHVDRLVQYCPPLRGAPRAFRAAFDRAPLPLFNELLWLLRGKNKALFLEHLLACLRTCPSTFQLMPPADVRFLVRGPLTRANPLCETFLEHDRAVEAQAAHSAVESGSQLLARLEIPRFSIFCDFHESVTTDLEYEVEPVDEPATGYRVRGVFALDNRGDGTVPAYSCIRGDDVALPVMNVRHAFFGNDPRVVSELEAVI